jgi:hypothetical protein
LAGVRLQPRVIAHADEEDTGTRRRRREQRQSLETSLPEGRPVDEHDVRRRRADRPYRRRQVSCLGHGLNARLAVEQRSERCSRQGAPRDDKHPHGARTGRVVGIMLVSIGRFRLPIIGGTTGTGQRANYGAASAGTSTRWASSTRRLE